jgi:hypothetical protein
MKVLVAFEYSGKVRDAFIRKGHDAISCDLRETESPGPHIVGDVFEILDDDSFDLLIAHPPCTFLASSGLHWNGHIEGRAEKTERALDDVRRVFASRIKRKAIENPRGCISTRIRPATQYIQPYWFGHDASKWTGLWLENLTKLRPTKFVEPRIITADEVDLFGHPTGALRWNNQTDSGQNNLPPTADREKIRSETYQGIADAMADQWG